MRHEPQRSENTLGELIIRAYDELRQIAAAYIKRTYLCNDLQPKEVVHEAYLRLNGQTRAQYCDRRHFVRVAAMVIRRVLADYHRQRSAQKRMDSRRIFDWDLVESSRATKNSCDPLVIDEALSRLRRVDPKWAEIVELRYFGGFNEKETAKALGVSSRTIRREWSLARTWLRTELSESVERRTPAAIDGVRRKKLLPNISDSAI